VNLKNLQIQIINEKHVCYLWNILDVSDFRNGNIEKTKITFAVVFSLLFSRKRESKLKKVVNSSFIKLVFKCLPIKILGNRLNWGMELSGNNKQKNRKNGFPLLRE
jgi:hypothetical protein